MFTLRESATVLAALRHWQLVVDPKEQDPETFDQLEPLNDEEIDKLCENIICDMTLSAARPVPALFEMEPVGVGGAMEANGRVYHFCTHKCQRVFAIDKPEIPRLDNGESADYIDDAVCDECGATLNTGGAR